MKLLLIPDKFKGSLTAEEVVRAISIGVQQVHPHAAITSIMASDGGEGFLDAIASYREVERVETTTAGPLGRPVHAHYLWQDSSKTAYVEMAMSSGLELLEAAERNPLHTTTWGTGLQIKDAIEKGAQTIYLGIGGSATNDGGIGVAGALGYKFLNASALEVQHTGSGLNEIHHIVPPKSQYEGIRFVAVNDVNNPLFGERGAAHVYGPQKGGDPEIVNRLDAGLRKLHEIVKRDLGKDKAELPGAGAAGGLAYGLSVFFDAEFISGTDFILGLAGLENRLMKSPPDMIITGEGRIDAQSLSGKLIQGVLHKARAHRIPVVAVCGRLDMDKTHLLEAGFKDVIEIRDPVQSLSYNMDHAAMLLQNAVKAYFRKDS